jgi:hypothetical protein
MSCPEWKGRSSKGGASRRLRIRNRRGTGDVGLNFQSGQSLCWDGEMEGAEGNWEVGGMECGV